MPVRVALPDRKQNQYVVNEIVRSSYTVSTGAGASGDGAPVITSHS
jgi:hypothetical protein